MRSLAALFFAAVLPAAIATQVQPAWACVPYYYWRCDTLSPSFDCCDPLICEDDGTGQGVNRCLKRGGQAVVEL
ncbi:hypothetical protein EDC01DRAFT_431678 [Geopyxis carbonaria]|nr:hypothetical protein EDC01DRAFT_431678 [Geopyxis carbonaria]